MWPWETVRAAEPRRRRRARRQRSTSSTTRPPTTRCRSRSRGCRRRRCVQTLHHAPQRGRGRAVVALPRGAVRRHLARAGAPARRPERRWASCRTAIDTDALHASARPRTTTCCSSAASRKGKGVLQAIEIARRAGIRLLLAAPENDYYREHVAPLVDGTRSSTRAKCGTRRKWRCSAARARCSIRCRPASRSASCWPKRWPAARPSPRSTAARCARWSTTA